MIADLWTLALVLVAGHFLCDFPLQGPYMSETKNQFKDQPGIPSGLILFGHASIHGAFVAIVTGQAIFGYVELVIHAIIDHIKCSGRITFFQDQTIHLLCKMIYFLILVVILR